MKVSELETIFVTIDYNLEDNDNNTALLDRVYIFPKLEDRQAYNTDNNKLLLDVASSLKSPVYEVMDSEGIPRIYLVQSLTTHLTYRVYNILFHPDFHFHRHH